MAWERRKRGGLYYTRSKWNRGRVVREYVGSGDTATLAAVLDDEERIKHEARREELWAQEARMEALDRQVGELCELAEQAMREELEAAGYHQHNRGTWRKRRG